MSDYDYLFKILLIGNSSVGKSCLLLRFSDNLFTDSFVPTIGVDFKINSLELESSLIKMQIWDTAGQERFKTITSSYYKGAHGIFLVFDLTDKQSFRDIENWLTETEKHASDHAFKFLIGNKSDLSSQRTVSYEEASNYAKNYNMRYVETSAKNSDNVNIAFETMAKDIKALVGNVENALKAKREKEKEITVKDREGDIIEKKGGCC